MQHFLACGVRKPDAVEIDPAANGGEVGGHGILRLRITHLRLDREDAPQPVHRYHRRLQRVPLLGDGVDRLEKLANIADERVQHAEFDALAQHRVPSDPYDKGDGQVAQNIERAVEQHRSPHLLQVGLQVDGVPLRKPRRLLLLLMKGLNQAHAGQIFRSEGDQPGQQGAGPLVAGAQIFAEGQGNGRNNRKQDHAVQGEAGVQGEHEDDDQNERQPVAYEA